MTVAAPPRAVCRFCGTEFKLTAGRVKDAAQPGGEPMCRSCSLRPAWWLERFALEELLEFGDLLGWP